jgi:hypothetical protein
VACWRRAWRCGAPAEIIPRSVGVNHGSTGEAMVVRTSNLNRTEEIISDAERLHRHLIGQQGSRRLPTPRPRVDVSRSTATSPRWRPSPGRTM